MASPSATAFLTTGRLRLHQRDSASPNELLCHSIPSESSLLQSNFSSASFSQAAAFFKMATKILEGHCVCGGCTWSTVETDATAQICYCDHCQRSTGAERCTLHFSPYMHSPGVNQLLQPCTLCLRSED